ncbi:MAG: gliding motility protein GldL [Bacteroidia bacterium]|nr:gliding motility protein GldL [Bacteroidia bacterium]
MGLNEIVESKAYKGFMGKLYGWGASVVILGALFKIQHYPGASIMLICGLGTEATIFFFSAFEPIHEEIDWTLAYPELAGMGKFDEEMGNIVPEKKKSAIEKFDEMIEKAEITPELFEKLGVGLHKLNETTVKLHDVTDATQATNNYVSNFEKASEKVLEFTDSYSKTAGSLNKSADGLTDTYIKSADVVNGSVNELAQIISKSGKEMVSNLSNAHVKTTETLNEAANGFAQIVSKTGTDVNSLITKSGEKLAENLSNAHVKSTETLNQAAGEFAQIITKTGENVNNMITKSSKELVGNLADAHVKTADTINQAANDFAQIISKTGTDVNSLVTQSGTNLADAYEKMTLSMNEQMAKADTENKSYGEQLELMTKNLTALNAVYELQLQGTNEHLEVSKQLFKGMDEMMTTLEDAIEDSKKYRTEVSKLGQNLSALNTVYGNMLSAMNFKSANS